MIAAKKRFENCFGGEGDLKLLHLMIPPVPCYGQISNHCLGA